MPDKAYATLKFQMHYELPGPPANVLFEYWSGNSLFSPEQPATPPPSIGTGQQPGGFLQWMKFFEKYTVLGSTMRCHVTNLSANPFRVSITPSFALQNLDTIFTGEQRYTSQSTVGSQENKNSVRMIKGSMGTRKLEGRSVDGEAYSGTKTTSPSKQWYWLFCAQGLKPWASSADDLLMSVVVNVTYKVEFSRRLFSANS